MSGTASSPAQAGDPAGGAQGSQTSLPWGQIPKFDPNVTDLRVYEQKMKFLHAIWPPEHIELLAPRAALQIEGAAFQKVARLDPAKLRTKDGVQYLIESIGGQWGRLSAEENYDLFERALYTVAQRGDESNDSYLARHDIAFEDLQSKGVTIDDVRAYVLVRQSTLSSEDRKKIIMDNSGKLTYEGARKSMRLLGSKFFQDLQNAGRGTQNKKTYDAYHLDEEEEDYQFAYTCENDGAVDEEHLFQVMLDQGDPDAAFIHGFEDQIMETLQESEDLAQCFVSYQEARARVKERAKARGFWPVKGKQKGKGFTKKGKNQNVPMGGYNSGFRKKSLTERIANSTCRICGAAGHWKRECPQRQEPRKSDTAASMPNDVHLGFLEEDVITEEVTTDLPDNAVDWQEPGKVLK